MDMQLISVLSYDVTVSVTSERQTSREKRRGLGTTSP